MQAAVRQQSQLRCTRCCREQITRCIIVLDERFCNTHNQPCINLLG